jgi:L-malate glycosyltransferase
MRVVMVGDFPQKADAIEGGVQAVTMYLAAALAHLPDIRLDAVTLDLSGGGARTISQRGIAVHFVPLSRRPSRLSNAQNVARLSARIRELEPDVVHAHIANQYAAAARSSGLPWVLTAHGVRHLEMALRRGLLNRYREWTIRREEFALIRAARHLISISPFITDVFAGDIRGRVTDIDNPVDEIFFNARRRPVHGRVLYVGRLIPRKDIKTLLQAFSIAHIAVPGCELRLAGEGIIGLEPGSYRGELADLIRTLRIEGSVRFLGQLDEESLVREYEACSLMVVSSVLETAPMVILQAMAAGVPVVSTDVGGIRYLVEDGKSGFLVPPRDVAALGARLADVLQNPELAVSMSRRARQIADSRLRAEDIARRTMEVYMQALESGSTTV